MADSKLKQIRKKNNLTQKALAEKLEIPYRTYTNYETGQRALPGEILVKLERMFGVDGASILDIEINSPTEREIKLGQLKFLSTIENLDPKAKEEALRMYDSCIDFLNSSIKYNNLQYIMNRQLDQILTGMLNLNYDGICEVLNHVKELSLQSQYSNRK